MVWDVVALVWLMGLTVFVVMSREQIRQETRPAAVGSAGTKFIQTIGGKLWTVKEKRKPKAYSDERAYNQENER